ncbi:MAG: hypothetical protein ACO3I4_05320 [Candidatus Kapaibacteriota bacterium]
MTAAGIDIGSNTILMVIVEGSAHQIVRVVEDVQSFPRLGQALGYQRYLPEEAVQRSCEVLTQYRTMLQEYPEAPVYAVATAAVREADNRVVVQQRLEAALGSPIHVIDGLRESELTFAGVGSLAESPTSLLIDIGGGSTEFVLGHSAESGAVPQVVQRWSIPIGAVRLSNMALPEEELRSVIRIALREQLPPHLIEDECDMIGVAGTAVAAAMLAGGITSYDAGAIEGMVVPAQQLRSLSSMLLACTPQELQALPGIESRRADILPAGMTILDEALRYVGGNGGATSIRISTRGVRYGAALIALQALPGTF